MNSSTPQVQWGPEPGKLPHTTPADSHTYTRGEMCGPPANSSGWMDPGLLHVAKLTGLVPGSRYYYRFGDKVRPGVCFRGLNMVGRWVGNSEYLATQGLRCCSAICSPDTNLAAGLPNNGVSLKCNRQGGACMCWRLLQLQGWVQSCMLAGSVLRQCGITITIATLNVNN